MGWFGSCRRQASKSDQTARPFVIVDPRAGHGPGIGGFKADSEIGMAMRAGHPCYFVGFLPEPMPGQTIEDIARAEAVFLDEVIKLHPAGRRQAMRDRQLPGRLGGDDARRDPPRTVRTDHHRRLAACPTGTACAANIRCATAAGLLGGSWLTALTSDLGRWQVRRRLAGSEFREPESRQHATGPSNTISTPRSTPRPTRYLDFERWWGGHVNLNAEEIQFIVDELFVGNNLAAGRIKTSDGTAIDLRSIRSPIVVFCSKGDNITPPQQALGWILDLYDDVDEIRSYGQTIVYTIHENVGHLGIFVSVGRRAQGIQRILRAIST